MITVYTTETCSFCAMVKKYLNLKEVPFQTIDVTHDEEKRTELFEKTGLMTVPVITDGENYITGFNPALLNKLIQNTIIK